MSKKIRLNKFLATNGIASRRKCEEHIFNGKVTVNGQITLLPQTMIDPETDKVRIGGHPVKNEDKKVYYILNKPAGYLCTNVKKFPTSKIVINLFKENSERLFTVGRLDKETTGLILVTNDGDFANKVIHPSSNITKEYLAKTAQEITPEHLVKVSEGAFVEDRFVKPIKVAKVRKGTIKVTTGEGRKREVRILLENAGLTVKELARIRIGNLTLGPLLPGQYRELTDREKELIFE